jgi:hypothetical protein
MKRWGNFSALVLSLIFVLSFAFAGIFVTEASAGAPEVEWKRYLGGPGEDAVWIIRQTSDGGYLVAAEGGGPVGGDIEDYKGTPMEYKDDDENILYWYARDYWVAKLDEKGGITWSKSYGGDHSDSALDFVEPQPGNYVITGFTRSGNYEGDDLGGPNWGRTDAWVFKIGADGDVKWTEAGPFGGVGYDTLRAIVQTPEEHAYVADGVKHETYVLTGATSSAVISADKGRGTEPIKLRENTNVINSDIWVHKLHEHGNGHVTEWSKVFSDAAGGAYYSSQTILNASDGGYVIGATIQDNGGDAGASEFWIFKVNEGGDKEWERKWGKEEDGFYYFGSMKATSDGGYILAGSKAEPEEDGGHDQHDSEGDGGHDHADGERNFDFVIVKLDKDGNVEWTRTYGRAGVIEQAWDVVETTGGYVVVGNAEPESVGLANQEAGLTYSDRAECLDVRIVKFDASGEVGWSMSLGGSSYDMARSIHRTSDGGYIVGGETWSSDWEGLDLGERGNVDGWAAKLAPETEDGGHSSNNGCDTGALALGALLLAAALFKRGRH